MMQTRRQLQRQQKRQQREAAIQKAKPLIPRPRTRKSVRTYTPRDIMCCLVASSEPHLVDELKQPGMQMTEEGRELIETIKQGGSSVEVDAVVQVRLASGIVVESRGRNLNVVAPYWNPRVPLRIQYGNLSLFGMHVSLSEGHLLSLNSFGYGGDDSVYMQNVEVFGNVKKKAHALQLLLDEIAYHLLHLQSTLRPELVDRGEPFPVIISLYDAWRPVPARDILPPWPYNDTYGRIMDSDTRWKHLTGTPSYYTQFGFVPLAGQSLANTSAQDAVQMQADMQKNYFELCVQPHKVAKTYTDAEPYENPYVCGTLPNDFGSEYFKVFEWGKPVRMFGAFAQTEVVFKDPEEYHDQVIKKGAYPPLETMSLQLVRSTTSGRKRPRGADTVTNAALRANMLGLGM
jgi:hypothetical protein